MGWLVTLLLAAQIALQYLVRPWRRLWLHKVLAFAIFVGATWHTMGAMHPGVRVGHASGLYIASLAWMLLAFQILVGFALERTSRHSGSLKPADSSTEPTESVVRVYGATGIQRQRPAEAPHRHHDRRSLRYHGACLPQRSLTYKNLLTRYLRTGRTLQAWTTFSKRRQPLFSSH